MCFFHEIIIKFLCIFFIIDQQTIIISKFSKRFNSRKIVQIFQILKIYYFKKKTIIKSISLIIDKKEFFSQLLRNMKKKKRINIFVFISND